MRGILRTGLGIAATLLFAVASAQGVGSQQEEPPVKLPTKPLLRIESGHHTAPIRAIATDPDGHFLATTSSDKTVRLWSLPGLDPLRVFRPPIVSETDGEFFGLAISPGAKYISVGTFYNGKDGIAVYVIERTTGKVVVRLGGLPQEAEVCKFSSDGTKLAIGMGDEGFQVRSIPDGALLASDDSLFGGMGNYVTGLDFGPKGSLVVSVNQGDVRLYDAAGKSIAQRTFPKHFESSAAFSLDEKHVLLSNSRSSSVLLLSPTTLETEREMPVPGVAPGSGFPFAFWTSDGGITAIGFDGGDSQRSLLLHWPAVGSTSPTQTTIPRADLRCVCQLRSGDVAIGSGEGFGVFSSAGVEKLWQPIVAASITGRENEFRVSPDATKVCFPSLTGDYLTYSLVDRRLTLSKAPDPECMAPKAKMPDFDPMNAWKNITNFDVFIAPELRVSAISSDERFVIGTNSLGISCYDHTGKEVWEDFLTGGSRAVNVSAQGKLAVGLFDDGTIRWFRLKDGVQLLCLYVHPQTTQWVAWTASGFYDCSAGGSNLIGWHINRGLGLLADFFPADHFSADYYRPTVVGHILETLDEAKAEKQADQERDVAFTAQDVAVPRSGPPVVIEAVLPPVVTILAEDGQGFDDPTVTVKYTVRTPTSEPITKIEYLIDGRPAKSDTDLSLIATADVTRQTSLTLPRRDANVSILAFNKYGASEPAVVSLRFRGDSLNSGPKVVVKPVLYVVAIGIGSYADSSLTQLKYPAADAEAFAKVMLAQKGGLYKDVVIYRPELINRVATTKAILDGLDWLRKRTSQTDVAMLFVAGHGDTDPGGTYAFLPTDFDPDHRLSTTVQLGVITDVIRSIQGKLIVLLDTCRAGAASTPTRGGWSEDVSGLVNQLSNAENGAVVVTACGNRELAEERDDWGHGAFTLALLEGFSGKAARKDGSITFLSLYEYVKDRVFDLTRGAQHPNFGMPKGGREFPIALSPTEKEGERRGKEE